MKRTTKPPRGPTTRIERYEVTTAPRGGGRKRTGLMQRTTRTASGDDPQAMRDLLAALASPAERVARYLDAREGEAVAFLRDCGARVDPRAEQPAPMTEGRRMVGGWLLDSMPPAFGAPEFFAEAVIREAFALRVALAHGDGAACADAALSLARAVGVATLRADEPDILRGRQIKGAPIAETKHARWRTLAADYRARHPGATDAQAADWIARQVKETDAAGAARTIRRAIAAAKKAGR